MSKIEQQILEHPVWLEFKRCQRLQNSHLTLSPGLSEEARWTFTRAFELLAAVEKRLQVAPSHLISRAILARLNNHITPILDAIEVPSRDTDDKLTVANGAIDDLLITATSIFNVESPFELSEVLKLHSQSSAETLRALEKRVSERSWEISKNDEEIGKLASKVEELSLSLAEIRAEARTIVPSISNEYQSASISFREEFNLSLREMEKENSSSMKGALRTAFTIIENMQEQATKAKEIVQIVGNVGTTGNYKNVALSEGRQANIWRIVTIVFFALGLAVAFWAALTAHGDVAVASLISRFVLVLVVVSVTLYTSRESARHRTNADNARRVELELASLGPFMEDLPKEQRDLLREKLTDRYFGKESSPHTVESNFPVEKVLELLQKIVDAKSAK